jgi:signal peptidase I
MMDWLANLSIRWVLILVGLFLSARVIALRLKFGSEHWRGLVAESAETFAVALVMVFLVLHRFVFQLFFIPSESMIPTLQVHDRILVNRFIYSFHPPRRGDVIVFHAPRAASAEPRDFIKRLIGLPGETVAVVPDTLLVDGKPLLPIVNRDEPEQSAAALQISPESRIEVAGSRLMVDGECLMAVSPTGKAHVAGRDLFIDGEKIWSFGPDETSRPMALPDSLRQAGHGLGMAFYRPNGNPLYILQGRKLAIRPGYVEVNGRPLTGEEYARQTPRYRLQPVRLGKDEYFMMGDNRNQSLDSHRWGSLKGSAIVGKAWALFWPPRRLGLVN